MNRYRIIALVVALTLVTAVPLRAAVMRGHVWQATYATGFAPTFGAARVPFTGVMTLQFNHGIISGTYESNSVRADPLFGRRILVSGNVSHGQILLNFATPANFAVRGTLDSNGDISGTATIRGRFNSFVARVKSSP
jgi:hypothetical protein